MWYRFDVARELARDVRGVSQRKYRNASQRGLWNMTEPWKESLGTDPGARSDVVGGLRHLHREPT
jgi:hypothetical protein